MGAESRGIDYEGISEAMEVLSNPNRLRILRQLLEPKTVGEIEIASERSGGAGGAGSRVSREGVRQHLEQLTSLGVVRRREARRPGGRAHEYLVDNARLYALTEEFRELGRLRPREAWASETLAGSEAALRPDEAGPRLVLVHGLEEGRAFPLEGEGPWRIGRSSEADVTLDFDPFVSAQNSELASGDAGFTVRDLPRSRNGTSLNWTRLPDGGSGEVEHGDVVGVGRTLLLFRR